MLIPEPVLPTFVKKPRVSVIAPAGSLADRKRYFDGCAILEDLGFTIVDKEKSWRGFGYLADTDQARLEEFHKVWSDPAIDIVFSLRGGYGSLRIFEQIDLDIVKKNPKIFIGFSDISILLNHLAVQTGLICFHGPVITSLPISCRTTIERLFYCLTGSWNNELNEDIEIIRSGPPAKGRLLGGNLSSLVTMIGTANEPDFSDSILFLEDVNEPLYRIDRLLTQFSLAGKLRGVRGILLGDFSFDGDDDDIARIRRQEAVWQRVCELTSDTGIPVWGKFPGGHCRKNLVLPIGAVTSMDQSRGILSFEAA